MLRKPYAKKPDLTSKTAKYIVARAKGTNKKESAIVAGYKGVNVSPQIERSKEFAVLTEYFADKLKTHISMDQIAIALTDNITQTENRSARNEAIKIALDKLEPEDKEKEELDNVIVVMSS